MKKSLPVILVACAVLIGLILYAVYAPQRRVFDDRVTLNEQGNNPYGMSLFYSMLPKTFPKARQTKELNSPGYWKSLDNERSNQALIIVTPQFDPEPYELSTLAAFARNGNYVFISAASYSQQASQYLGVNGPFFNDYFINAIPQRPLAPLPFSDSLMSYPGKSIRNRVMSGNRLAQVHAVDTTGVATLISYRVGTGRLIIALDPLALSNYYLLYKNNIHFYQAAASLIPTDVSVVAWDKYFVAHRSSSGNNNNNDKPQSDWLSNLMKFKEFAWALLTALAFFVVFLILRMRRKQRELPIIKKPKNETLQFVRVLGRLYREKGDHHGLALKMATYFKDFVRTRYFINPQVLDEAFMQSLQYKSGIAYGEIYSIVYFINTLESRTDISSEDLIEFHQRLEKFYEFA